MKDLDKKTFLSRSARIEALSIFGFFSLLLAVSIAVEGFEYIVVHRET